MRFMLAASAALAVFLTSDPALSDQPVRGYVKKDGTYVQSHRRTSPNHTKADNYSTKGNTNPYTGKRGTRSPYKSTSKQ